MPNQVVYADTFFRSSLARDRILEEGSTMAAKVETRTVPASDGRDLCVETAGVDSGTPVLVQHGAPGSRLLYGPWIADAERQGIRLISYDRPGYGGSSPAPGHRVADGAADVRVIAEALGVDQMAVWGYSGGGPYALACAALLPDLVVAVATVGSLAPYGAPGFDYFAGMGDLNIEDTRLYFSDPDAARKQTREARDQMLEATPEQGTEGLATLLSPVDAAQLTGEFAEWLRGSTHEGLAPGDQGWWDDGAAHLAPWGFELETISVSVKVWHGRHDRFVPFQHGQWLAEHVPGAESVLSDDDGHLTLLAGKVGDVHTWLLDHF
ncbi:MAG: alpha/beta fold hydrolase [Candidatus Dormiibacterota bacterium]